MEEKQSIGVDVSKDKFDVCYLVYSLKGSKIKGTRSFENNSGGFELFVNWIKHKSKVSDVFITMEATGVYYEYLAMYLDGQGYYVSVLVPNKAKQYKSSLGLRSKTDSIDSKGLAYMGAEQQLKRWEPLSEQMYSIRTLTRHIESQQEQLSSCKNQLHAMELSLYKSDLVITQTRNMIAFLEEQIASGKELIKEYIHSDDELKSKVENLSKISGLSVHSLSIIISESNGFKLFENSRQLVSYCGYDVVENSSGLHVGRTKISKRGNKHIRRALYMPALTAIRCREPQFYNLYERVYERSKVKMKGVVAVQKKLLVVIYSLWKSGEQYDRSRYKVGEINPPTQDELKVETQNPLSMK